MKNRPIRCFFSSWVLIASTLIAVSLLGAPANAQDVLGGLTLGAFLNKTLDQVDQAIADARNSGNAVAIEAGRQAALAIQDAQNAYADSLNKTAAQLNQSVLSTVSQISSLSNDIISKTNQTVQNAETKAQEITNSLPFANKEPQVTSVSPNFVVPKDNAPSNNLEINFLGNFPGSSAQGFEPTLKVNGQIFEAHNTTQKLTFLVPQGVVFPQTAIDPNKLQFATVSLILPWQADQFFGLFHVRREDHFSVLVGSLPASPGSVTVLHTVNGTQTVTKLFCSPNIHQCSTRECGNNDDKNHVWVETPESGWNVVRNTSHIKMGSSQGDFAGPGFISDDANRVVYWATTIHHGFGSSGSMDFSICFTEEQDRPTSHTDATPVSLKWGDSRSFDYAAGSWKVIFADFTGKTSEFTGPNNGNPFLTIKDEGGKLVIETKDPDHLAWP